MIEQTTVLIWTYSDESWGGIDLSGFDVEARDGSIGHIDEATNDAGGSYLVVDTGPWIFGKKVMLPAGVVERMDTEERNVHVDLTKDQIKNAPEFDESSYRDASYRDEVGGYYGREMALSANRPVGPDYARDDRTDRVR